MSIITPFKNILNNSSTFIGHTRTVSTSPKKIQLKDQLIQQISTIISFELNKIDTRDIETKLSIYFNMSENDYMAYFDAGGATAEELLTHEIHEFAGGSLLMPFSINIWKMN